jgi:hypothetical protein
VARIGSILGEEGGEDGDDVPEKPTLGAPRANA